MEVREEYKEVQEETTFLLLFCVLLFIPFKDDWALVRLKPNEQRDVDSYGTN